MGPLEIGMAIIATMVFLILVGLPVGFALLLTSFAWITVLEGFQTAVSFAGILTYSSVATYSYTVLPLFMFMGIILSEAGFAADIFVTARNWLGNLKGGLAIAATMGAAMFGAVCGSSSATAAAMGTIAYPEMRKLEYDPALSLGSLAVGGTLAIMIPPSLTMIVYGTLVEESIGRLFIAGLIPGILLTCLLCLSIWGLVSIRPQLAKAAPGIGWRERFVSLRNVWSILLIFLMVIGGIYAGLITAMEAGAIGAVSSLALVLVTRRVQVRNVGRILKNTGILTARVVIIILGAQMFSHLIVISGFGRELSQFVTTAGLSTYLVLMFMVLVYLFLGMLMDMIGMLVITLPIFIPILEVLDINFIWFGVFVTLLGEVCLVTPPVGLNCYVLAGVVKDAHVEDVFKGIFPLLPAFIVEIVLIVIFPQIVLFLPNAMYAH